jgi:DNA-binding transcriptional MerR regulator
MREQGMTIQQWRDLIEKTNSMYAPIDILADWEAQVAALEEKIERLEKREYLLQCLEEAGFAGELLEELEE